MSLRRRLFGASEDRDSHESSRTPSPAPTTPSRAQDRKASIDGNGDPLVQIRKQKLERLNSYVKEKRPKSSKRRNAWIFGLGGLFGLILALFVAGNNDVIDLSYLREMNLEGLYDVLPAGMVKDAQELQVSIYIQQYSSSLTADEGLRCSLPSSRNVRKMLLPTTRSQLGLKRRHKV